MCLKPSDRPHLTRPRPNRLKESLVEVLAAHNESLECADNTPHTPTTPAPNPTGWRRTLWRRWLHTMRAWSARTTLPALPPHPPPTQQAEGEPGGGAGCARQEPGVCRRGHRHRQPCRQGRAAAEQVPGGAGGGCGAWPLPSFKAENEMAEMGPVGKLDGHAHPPCCPFA